jgi:hypothetical protein
MEKKMSQVWEVKRRFGLRCASRCAAFLCLLGISSISLAQSMEETMIYSIPPGYRLGYSTVHGNMHMSEFVPINESVDNWTEMVTLQTFIGMKNVDMNRYRAIMNRQWTTACPVGNVSALGSGVQRGYPAAFMVMSCPLNLATQKPEITYFEVVQGNDNFYVVQKAFKFTPTMEQMQYWTKNMRLAVVCDNRLADRPCPKLGAKVPNFPTL